MSLQPKEIKAKRISQITTGTHLVMIADILYLRNAAKELILNHDQHPTLIVMFKNDKSQIHEQHYILDGDKKQEQFQKMITIAQVPMIDGKPNKKDAIGKRLWIAVREVHHIMDGQPIIDDGVPVIEYFIFRVSPYIDGGKKPLISGDPNDNNGIASGVFIDYKNFESTSTIGAKVHENFHKEISTPKQIEFVPDSQEREIDLDSEPKF